MNNPIWPTKHYAFKIKAGVCSVTLKQWGCLILLYIINIFLKQIVYILEFILHSTGLNKKRESIKAFIVNRLLAMRVRDTFINKQIQ